MAPDPAAVSIEEAGEGSVPALIELGLAYALQHRNFEAAAAFQSALRLDAGNIAALLNLGTAWRHLGHRDAALPCYRLAAKLAPGRVEPHFLLGTLLCELRELDEAVAVHRHGLELAPDHPGILTDLGSALVLQGAREEGLALLERAVALAPSWPVGHVNLGIARTRERRFDEALAAFRAAQSVDPSFVYARFCESNLYLMLGDYERGYGMYDAHRAVYPHRHRERRWEGGPLGERTILLYAQHGLGDTLQFVRYVPRVAAMGGRVVLQIQDALLPLLGDQPGAAAVIASNAPTPDYDVQATLLELPAIVGDTLDSIPADVPYLRTDPRLRERWAAALAGDRGFKVGIAWHGNPLQKDGLIRRCSLLDMAAIWEVPGVTVYSLQVGAGSEELADAGGRLPVRALAGLDTDAGAFMDTAAVMESLDLVVTIDTSVAHLAGGLGRPVWMVLPYWSDWRWLVERADSPWYPTMRIFRQPRPGDWHTVFAEVAAALRERIERPPAPARQRRHLRREARAADAGRRLHRFEIRGVTLLAYDEEGSEAAERVAGELWNDVYGLESIPFAPGDVVVDVGAHVGLVSLYLAKRWPFLRIHAFEPHPRNYRNCAASLRLNEVTAAVQLSPLAITGDGRPVNLRWVASNTGGATAVFRLPAGQSVGPVRSITLGEVFAGALAPAQRCRLLKLDCEGMEYEILAQREVWERVDYLSAELHEQGLADVEGESGPDPAARRALAELCARRLPPERLRLLACSKVD